MRYMAWVSWISFIGIGVLLVLALTLSWQYFTGDSFVKSLYWSVQTFTTVGYRTGFDNWGQMRFLFQIQAVARCASFQERHFPHVRLISSSDSIRINNLQNVEINPACDGLAGFIAPIPICGEIALVVTPCPFASEV